jgi:activator of 2-hydroxyglutaryl-CoA dehydratase
MSGCGENREEVRIDVKIDDLLRSTHLRGRAPAEVESGSATEPFVIRYMVGIDVGSTTVKSVVVDAATDAIIWQDYQRH